MDIPALLLRDAPRSLDSSSKDTEASAVAFHLLIAEPEEVAIILDDVASAEEDLSEQPEICSEFKEIDQEMSRFAFRIGSEWADNAVQQGGGEAVTRSPGIEPGQLSQADLVVGGAGVFVRPDDSGALRGANLLGAPMRVRQLEAADPSLRPPHSEDEALLFKIAGNLGGGSDSREASSAISMVVPPFEGSGDAAEREGLAFERLADLKQVRGTHPQLSPSNHISRPLVASDINRLPEPLGSAEQPRAVPLQKASEEPRAEPLVRDEFVPAQRSDDAKQKAPSTTLGHSGLIVAADAGVSNSTHLTAEIVRQTEGKISVEDLTMKPLPGSGTPPNQPDFPKEALASESSILLIKQTYGAYQAVSDFENYGAKEVQSLTAAPPSPVATGFPPPTVLPSNMVVKPIDQIVVAIRESTSGGIDLQMQPEELGVVRISLRQEGEILRVHLTAERPETLELLRRSAAELELSLGTAGHSSTSFSFGQSSREQQPKSGALSETTPEPMLFATIDRAQPLKSGRLDLRL